MAMTPVADEIIGKVLIVFQARMWSVSPYRAYSLSLKMPDILGMFTLNQCLQNPVRSNFINNETNRYKN